MFVRPMARARHWCSSKSTSGARRALVEQFSLIFHAPPGEPFPDGIHRLEHAALGRVDLFIVPVGAPNAHRTAYQACFSRRVEDVSHV